jgi:hypothetical protein
MVCVRVCVVPEFYAFYAFSALIESVSYANMETSKVQVPLRHQSSHFRKSESLAQLNKLISIRRNKLDIDRIKS